MALILREKHVRALLTMPDTVAVLERAFGAFALGKVQNEPRLRLGLSTGYLNILATAAPSLGVIGHKTYTAFRGGVRYAVFIFDAREGHLLAIVEAAWLGAMRTGGTSALATKHLARPSASTVGMIGAGEQAITQLMGMCAVRPISAISVFSRHPDTCAMFCQEMQRLLQVHVQPAPSAQQAVENADIVITATSASEPVLYGEWLKPGCHINAIGSNWPKRREIDIETLERSTLIVTDSLEQAHMEAGDFVIPAEEGDFDWERVYELSEVLSGHAPTRELPDDITLYKGTGTGLEDIATAAYVYQLAWKQHVGEEIDLLD